mmetsp:Transcript_19776/g.30978  ORF Transcript_19776/g.30978 Transcript_19776/m.30978 type:complete len:255 (+) Transcript_19776:275-1039(+)
MSAYGRNGGLLDLGANVGFFSLSAAAHGFSAIAVEPLEYNTELLRRSIESNNLGSVTIVQKAVSNSSGERACMETNLQNQSGNGAVARHGWEQCKEVVELTTVDQLLVDVGNPCIRAVKVDLEGFDVEALQGAASLLTGIQPTDLTSHCCNHTRQTKLVEWRRARICRPCLVVVEMLSSYQQLGGLYDHTDLTRVMESSGYTLVHFMSWTGMGVNDGDYLFGLLSDDTCHNSLSSGLRRFMRPDAPISRASAYS